MELLRIQAAGQVKKHATASSTLFSHMLKETAIIYDVDIFTFLCAAQPRTTVA
jgi:hypothetical protein